MFAAGMEWREMMLHLRTIPHLFDPEKIQKVQKVAVKTADKLLLILDETDPEASLDQGLDLACAAFQAGLVLEWLFLVPAEPERLNQLQRRVLEQGRAGLPALTFQTYELTHLPLLLLQSRACFSLSQAPETCLRQAVQSLAMETPFVSQRFESPASLWAELPVQLWEGDPVEVLKKQLYAPPLGLRVALLKALGLERVKQKADLLKTEMVILLFWGRSGSVFLQSLLDGHPEILTTPATVLMTFYEVWPRMLQALAQKSQSFTLPDLLDIFAEFFPSLFYADPDTTGCHLNQLGPDQQTVLAVSRLDFKQAFQLLVHSFFADAFELSTQQFLLLLHYAYEMAQGQDISEKHLIAYQLHRPFMNICTETIFKDFPETRVLGMVREPMRGLFSHLRMFVEDQREGRYGKLVPDYRYEDAVFEGMFLNYYSHQLMGWKVLRKRYQPAIYEQQLEALHAQPESEMRRLAAWLGVAWHESLLESTFNGLQYWGDKRAHQKIQGFSAAHPLSETWQDYFSTVDKEILYALLAKELKRQGYEAPFSFVSMMLPLMIFWPTRLEQQALNLAIQRRDSAACELWFLHLLERWRVCFGVFFERET